MTLDKKGQGALEYLLLIGGAVLVAVIVITLLLSITEQGETQTTKTTNDALCVQRLTLTCPDNSITEIRGVCNTGAAPDTVSCPT
tara:strand:+ start:587 stop:841 length:255 start_codon:yes stop_codon:yes gene_type:complete